MAGPLDPPGHPRDVDGHRWLSWTWRTTRGESWRRSSSRSSRVKTAAPRSVCGVTGGGWNASTRPRTDGCGGITPRNGARQGGEMLEIGKFDEPDIFVEPDVDEIFDRARIKDALEQLEREE